LAGADFVTTGERRVFNLRTVQVRAVTAVAIVEGGALRAAFNGEMDAGHKCVVREGKIGAAGGAAEGYRLTGADHDFFAGHRSGFDFEDYAHVISIPIDPSNTVD
jgi:hypothetical protein